VSTPGGATGGGGPGGAVTPGGGSTLPVHHGKTARQILKLNWNYPVFKVKLDRTTEGTVATAAESALPENEAFQYLSGDDRRPMLVLRECKTCNGTDNALLSSAEDNARTFVMSRWFNCIKLPTQVLEANYPFHALFDEEHPPHLFLCKWDGSEPVTLKGDQSRTELWDSMQQMLSRYYLADAKDAVAEIEKILAQYDVLDARIERIREQTEKVAEDEGLKSKKLKSLQKDLAKARADLEKLKRREAIISDLGLKQEEAQASPAGA